MPVDAHQRRLTLALYLLCVAVLMIVLDTTVVTVALPFIATELGLSNSSLMWLVNAYTIPYGGFLLLSGRLGDLYGPRRLFLGGVVIFTLASLTCGLAGTYSTLLIARALQGLAGAVITAVSLSLISNLFADSAARAKAMALYGFVCAAGGGLGDVLGGLLTQVLNWHWIFLINFPIGVAVYVSCGKLLARDGAFQLSGRMDVAGAVAITSTSVLTIYALTNGNGLGWSSAQMKCLTGAVAILLLWFFINESRAQEPLIPLRLLRFRNLTLANVIGVLWAAGAFAWFVIAAFYLQRVLHYGPLGVGLAFLPATVTMAVLSINLSAAVVIRFGSRGPLCLGLLLVSAGLSLFARAPANGKFLLDVLPGMLLLGLGGGLTATPLLVNAMADVKESDSGLASGVANTSMMLGGALGLAILTSAAEARTDALGALGLQPIAALNAGYHLAFIIGAALTAVAAVLGTFVLQSNEPSRRMPECNELAAAAPKDQSVM